MKKILVTGANGFIGSALVRAFWKEYDVYGLGRYKSETVSIIWDFFHELPERKLPSNIDVIIHAGGIVGMNNKYSEDDYNHVNVQSCKALADYGAKIHVSQLIYLSTGGLYEMGTFLHKETDPILSNNKYLTSKAKSEEKLQKFNDLMNVMIIRLFFPYGPGQSGRLIPKLVENISNDLPIQLNDLKGRPRIAPIYISDVIFVIDNFIRMKYSGIINLSGPNIVSIRELAENIGDLLNKIVLYEILGISSKDLLGDNTCLFSLLPDFRLTNIREGLSKTFLMKSN